MSHAMASAERAYLSPTDLYEVDGQELTDEQLEQEELDQAFSDQCEAEVAAGLRVVQSYGQYYTVDAECQMTLIGGSK